MPGLGAMPTGDPDGACLQKGSSFRGTFDFTAEPFDWGEAEEKRPRLATKDLVIYELPLHCFTAAESSDLPEGKRGTFLGLKDKARDGAWALLAWAMAG